MAKVDDSSFSSSTFQHDSKQTISDLINTTIRRHNATTLFVLNNITITWRRFLLLRPTPPPPPLLPPTPSVQIPSDPRESTPFRLAATSSSRGYEAGAILPSDITDEVLYDVLNQVIDMNQDDITFKITVVSNL